MHRLQYRRQARNYLARLPSKIKTAIVNHLHALAIDPDDSSLDIDSLGGNSGYRLRVGKYRVIYTRHDDRVVIEVVRVRPRGDIYKR